MNKADKYLQELLWDIEHNGVWSKKPRTKWSDGTPANYKSVYNKEYTYDISKGEFPITTLRTTPFRGCFEEMRWIYQLQSNVIEDAHESIRPWWKDFVTEKLYRTDIIGDGDYLYLNEELYSDSVYHFGNPTDYTEVDSIGKTYGYIVKKYDLMNKLLHNLEHNPESRRNIINLWDNQCQMEDPKALPPCAFMTKWMVREGAKSTTFTEGVPKGYIGGMGISVKYVDLTLFQRSKDTVMVYSINPTEYVMLQMMVCGHLTWATRVLHEPGFLFYKVEDEHVYDRNYWAVKELLEKQPTGLQPKIELICEPKNFYDYRWEDFKISGTEGIEKLSKKLEIAV